MKKRSVEKPGISNSSTCVLMFLFLWYLACCDIPQDCNTHSWCSGKLYPAGGTLSFSQERLKAFFLSITPRPLRGSEFWPPQSLAMKKLKKVGSVESCALSGFKICNVVHVNIRTLCHFKQGLIFFQLTISPAGLWGVEDNLNKSPVNCRACI